MGPIKPVSNWRDVLKHAWSVRLILAAAVLSGLEVALPLVGQRLPIDDITRALLYFLIVSAALVARLVAQKTLGTKE